MTRARRHFVTIIGVLVAGGVCVGSLWLWLHGSARVASVDPPLPEVLTPYDDAVVDLIRDAAAEVRAVPDDGRTWFTLGAVYEANELYDLAAACYTEALDRRPDEAHWWYRRAMVRSVKGDLAGAIADMSRSLDLRPRFSPALWRIGLWHLDVGELEDAERSFRASISANPDDPGGTLGLARTLLQADRNAEALALLEPMAADARRATPYASQLLGTALYRLGREDEARLAMARAATGEANWADPTLGAIMQFGLGYGGRMLQARDLASRGDLRAAIIMLERLHEQRPDNALIANNLAAACRAVGDVDRSLALLEPVIAAHPDFYPARYTMAVVIQGLLPRIPEGEQEAMIGLAIEHLRHALRVNPAYAQAAALEGDLLRGLDRPREAMDAYRQAAEQDPMNPVWSFQLAEMELAVGRDAEAIARLEALWRTWPQQIDIAVTLAEAYVRSGDVAGADRIASDLAGRFPTDPRTSSLHARLASLRTGGDASR